MLLARLRDRARRDSVTEALELTLDSAAAPGGILPGEPHDELSDPLHDSRTADAALRRVSPLGCDEFPVPAEDRVWSDDGDAPCSAGSAASPTSATGILSRMDMVAAGPSPSCLPRPSGKGRFAPIPWSDTGSPSDDAIERDVTSSAKLCSGGGVRRLIESVVRDSAHHEFLGVAVDVREKIESVRVLRPVPFRRELWRQRGDGTGPRGGSSRGEGSRGHRKRGGWPCCLQHQAGSLSAAQGLSELPAVGCPHAISDRKPVRTGDPRPAASTFTPALCSRSSSRWLPGYGRRWATHSSRLFRRDSRP